MLLADNVRCMRDVYWCFQMICLSENILFDQVILFWATFSLEMLACAFPIGISCCMTLKWVPCIRRESACRLTFVVYRLTIDDQLITLNLGLIFFFWIIIFGLINDVYDTSTFLSCRTMQKSRCIRHRSVNALGACAWQSHSVVGMNVCQISVSIHPQICKLPLLRHNWSVNVMNAKWNWSLAKSERHSTLFCCEKIGKLFSCSKIILATN